MTLDILGYIAAHTGEHAHALDYYRQALALLHEMGDTSDEANTLDRLGHTYATLGNHEHARAVWRDALHLYREQGRDTDADRVQRQLDDLDRSGGGTQPSR